MDFRLLGPLEVEGDSGSVPLGGPKQRAVLAHLLLRANRLVSASRLIDDVWDGEPPAAARNVLQSYVSRLRRSLGPERLVSRSGGYVLSAEPSEVDLHRFEALVREARTAAALDPDDAVGLYRRADELWRGPALGDLGDQPSLRGDVAQLEELRASAAEERVLLELALGRHAELVPELEARAAGYPLREGSWTQLMVALYRSGRQADALAAYRRAREILVSELGIEPSPELRRVEAQVLTHDPQLDLIGVPLRGFRLLERVGEGSFGVVHRALQPGVGREVAVKVIRPSLADDEEFIRRFETEAQIVARLEHPHIVPLYDYWREPGGAYLVMRFLRGGSLRDALARGPLSLEETVGVVTHVGTALATAHRQGIVHRDVKPANILFDEERNAYLSDFGIARDVTASRYAERPGSAGSSVYYLSPEEVRGEAPTARSDVFSLGLVLYETLAGAPSSREAQAEDVPAGGPRPPALSLHGLRADVPAGVEEVLRRSTADDPDARYPDAFELVSALTDVAAAGRAGIVVPAGPARNPYKGLRPFGEADAGDFAGREVLVRRLLERLGESRLLAVVGPSGSGKSSVLAAGLVPAVRAGEIPGSERWLVAEMRPGDDPFAELEEALTRLARAHVPHVVLRSDRAAGIEQVAAGLVPEGVELLLVIDQFEELFTRVHDEESRAEFLAALGRTADAGGRIRVVAALRADALDRALAYGDVADHFRRGAELVAPLQPDELERAVSAPADRVGVTVERDLLARLVSDVRGQPGALPFLQFTLAELFDRREGSALTLAAYDALGGVAGAVARGAEEVYAALPADGKDSARQLFLRLVEPGEGEETVRRRVPLGELDSVTGERAASGEVLGAFGRRRLLSFDRDAETREPTVELAHEALLVAWERLQGWLRESADDLRMRQRLEGATRDWLESGRDPSFLASGSRLEQLASWRSRSGLAVTPVEHEFLDAATAHHDRALFEDAARRTREQELRRSSGRRLRGLVGALAVGSLVAAGLALFGFERQAAAERERTAAETRELTSAALTSLGVDPERSVLLALEAVRRARSTDGPELLDATEALHRAVGASRVVLRVPDLGGALDWSPDGTQFVTEGPEGSGLVDIRDPTTGERLRSFHGHDVDVNLVAYSADGSRLATTGDDGALRVWDPAAGELLRAFTGRGEVWGAAFSPDGSLVAGAWWQDDAVRIWELATGRLVREVAPASGVLTTSFSPDGTQLAIATFDAGGIVVDVSSGRIRHRLAGQRLGVRDVDWSPDGRWIATSSPDSTVRIWDAKTGRPRFTLSGHRSEVVVADWSADSSRLVTGSNDGTARVWTIGDDGTRELLVLPAQERGGGLWVAFSPDGGAVMTGDQAITAVRIWDVGVTGSAEWATVPIAAGAPGGVAFTPDGTAIVTRGTAGALEVWDAETGLRRSSFRGRPTALTAAHEVAVSSTGLVAEAAGDVVRVWELATGALAYSVRPGAVEDLSWSADGSDLGIAVSDGAVWTVRRGRMTLASSRQRGFRVSALELGADGRYVATARVPRGLLDSGPSRVTVWERETRRAVATVPEAAEAVAFSPDGSSIATAPVFGPVRVWDAGSGEEQVRLVGHTGAVNDVEYSPDGSLLATGSADGTVRLWDADGGVELLTLSGHDDAVWDVAFSPDGTKLASASAEGVVRVWALDVDDLVGIAGRKVTRELTDAECRQYLPARECG